jgi:hypothetical protein
MNNLLSKMVHGIFMSNQPPARFQKAQAAIKIVALKKANG